LGQRYSPGWTLKRKSLPFERLSGFWMSNSGNIARFESARILAIWWKNQRLSCSLPQSMA
jgi:hypothetical protein